MSNVPFTFVTYMSDQLLFLIFYDAATSTYLNQVNNATSSENAFKSNEGVNLHRFLKFREALYPILRLRDAIQLSAKDEGSKINLFLH